MKFLVISVLLVSFFHLNQAGPLRLQKRAAFYIANETACVVDNTVYNSGDPIPTDDPCEACRCRPPGFACVLKECESKPGCRAVRRAGQCCPEYICDSDNSTRVDDGFSSEKAVSNEETTVYPKTSELTPYSELPENTADPQVTKNENNKESPEASPPESLDASLLFSVNEGEETIMNVQTTKKAISTESVPDEGLEEISLDAESNEEVGLDNENINVTEIQKSDFEIIHDDEKKEPEISSEHEHSEDSEITDASVVTDKNVEIFPVEESTTVEANIKTSPPAEVTETVSSTTILPDHFEDTSDESNELIKRLRSLKNLTSDDATEPPKEKAEVKINESSTKESTEVVATSVVTEKSTTVKFEKDIAEEDLKEIPSSDSTTEEVAKSETLYYNSEAKIAPESVETVTTVVEVKEPTNAEKVDVGTSSPTASNEPTKVLFKTTSDVPEANNKPEITVKSNESTTSQTAVGITDSTIPKIEDVSTSTNLQSENEKSEVVKLYADESKIVPTPQAPKITELENSTTVVIEINSEKVETSEN